MANFKCRKGTSQCILLSTSTLIFLIAAAAMGVSIYIYLDAVAKSVTRVSLLTVIGSVSLALMSFAIMGCKAAVTPPQKKCSRCMYLTVLLVLFLAEFIAAGYVFNLGHALDVAKEKGFDIRGNVTTKVDKAAEDALTFLHDQLNDLYVDESCTGGAAAGDKLPIHFGEVSCKKKGAQDAFHELFKGAAIETQPALETYTNCTANPKFSKSNKDFTQSFCGSETHIVSLARKYARYLVWFPVALAGLTFILLVATICLIAAKNKERRQQIRMMDGREPFQGQMSVNHV